MKSAYDPHPPRSLAQRKKINSELGSGLIELALVMPIFLVMLFGFINFMLVMFGLCNMTFAARSATRYICLHSTPSYGYTNDTAVAAAVTNIVNQFIFKYPSNTQTSSIAYSTSVNSSGYNVSTVVVTLTATYKIVLPGYTYNGLTLSTAGAGVIVQ